MTRRKMNGSCSWKVGNSCRHWERELMESEFTKKSPDSMVAGIDKGRGERDSVCIKLFNFVDPE